MDVPYASCLRIKCRGTDKRLRTEKRKRFCELFVQSWSVMNADVENILGTGF
jgi:hypothetical protein